MSHAPLHPDTRNLLAREILKAREAAEAGARASLAALRVGEASPAEGMSAQERSLRNRLRANGRQLGDLLLADGKQELGYLVEEIAYQHWHRMLFARFLAENGLLREDGGGQPIDLSECEALANAEGLDVWAFAARCAQKMLPGVFRVDDPKMELRLDTPKQIELNAILKNLPSQVFTATDALGWVYQYWQDQRKKEVNDAMKGGLKVGAKELSPVTQLFTEDYMVDFLLHNTLGAWWAGKMGPIESATEEEARAKAGLPAKNGLPAVVWTYLRFVQDAETKKWTPAGGTFEGWPKRAKDITFLDPCMGSGHFPVFALPILARMRMEEEGGAAAENIHATLKDQIHGLELDQRCCQIGAFNLALTAWKLAGFQQLPPLNIACCGIAPRAKLDDWVKLAGNDEKLKAGMARLHKLFEQAPVLGSLINPRAGEGDLLTASYRELRPLLETALSAEAGDESAHEMAVAAKGVAKAAEVLTGHFTLVATNVPFLGYREMVDELRVHVTEYFEGEKGDLGYCLWRRLQSFAAEGATTSFVSLQHWLSLHSYKALREQLLNEFNLSVIVHLGTGAFETITGQKVNVTLTIATKSSSPMEADIALVDVANSEGISEKKEALARKSPSIAAQKKQYANPDHRISFGNLTELPSLSTYADCLAGVMNGDSPKFIRSFWEMPHKTRLWAFLQSTVPAGKEIGGLESIILFDEENGHLREEASIRRLKLHNADERGNSVWGRPGVAISQMSSLPASRYFGDKYDSNVAAIVSRDPEHLPAIWAFCTSRFFHDLVRAIDRKLNVTNATFGKVPFDLEHWRKIAAEKYPDGLPKPFSSDPTQWLFNGHPHKSDNPLQVAVARMLGYKWPRQTSSSFPNCPALGPDGLEKHHDDDGVVPLAAINREEAAATRLRALLKDAYGSEWNPATTEKELLAAAGHSAATLEEWLQGSFFEEHCKLFHNRPFVWHIWDGQEDGFHVLVNYHRLAAGKGDGTRLLQKIATTYLGDWIARCNQEVAADKPGAARRLKAAQDLQADLRKILEGEAPHDIFVRWKPLHEQAIGWTPDINDGVRLNIRPFLTVRDVGKKGAGLLRFKPNIKWDKDRGKEPERLKSDFPWFWTCDPESNPQHVTDFAGGSAFTGERWNDLHYTVDAKKAARTKKA